MKTSVIEVRDMLSVLSVQGIEKRIGDVAGVESVTVNYAAGTATVRYDETRLDLAAIRSNVRQNAYDSDALAPSSEGGDHKDHKAPEASHKTGMTGTEQSDKSAPGSAPSASEKPSTPAPAGSPTSPVSKPEPGAAPGASATATPAGHKKPDDAVDAKS